jgi:hypothetical protein
MSRLPTVCACLTLLAMSGCGYSTPPRSHTDEATIAACRKYAAEVYNERNRGEIYSVDQTGLPYSASHLAGNQTNTLAEQYANEKLIEDCIRNTGPGIDRDSPTPPGAKAP